MAGKTLEDRFGRRFRYLRLSITPACNFRCGYCLPGGWQRTSASCLSRDEIRRLVRGFSELGVSKVRITGGEPLMRADVLDIVRDVSAVPGIECVAMTTNGYRLAGMADSLRSAGLSAVNISLDSLDPHRFRRITGYRRHGRVLEAIDAAQKSGIPEVKINTVLLRALNEDEIPDFIEFVRHRPVTLRFIELMRTDGNAEHFAAWHMPGDALAASLRRAGWEPVSRGATDGPAEEFRHAGYRGRIGLIRPYRAGFCESCNRLRINASGGLRLCLFGNGTHDLRRYLGADAGPAELEQGIVGALFGKRASHLLQQGDYGDTPHLASTGG